jgi:hypothetical protein
VRRYALYGVLGLLGLGAVSNILNPQSDPVATPLPSRALIAAPPTSTATIASRPSPTLSPTPSPSPSPTLDPTPKPTPTRIVAVDDGFNFVEPDGREEFRGTNGTYTYSAIAFSAERATVRWTATAPTGASCRVVWRLDPSSGSTIKRTVKVSAGAKVSGNARYGTTFDDAAFLVDSTCPQWNMSITGQKRPASGGGSNCDPSYPGVCIPPHPPDLDCGDVEYRRFDVIGSDPHGFDGDNDGIGCESG